MILKPEDPKQLFFISRSELVSSEELVRTVEEVVNRLDLQPLYACWSEKGRSYYDPGMMLKVLFFAYCDGERRSRQIAKKIRYDIRYQYFTGSLRPEYRTICRFRNIDADLLAGYFAEIVGIIERMGLLDTSAVAIDGTKIRASASGRKTYRDKDKLEKRYRKLLMEDAIRDSEEIGDEDCDAEQTEPMASGAKPKAISDSELKRRILKAKESLENGEGEVNITDADARFMKTSEGTIRLSYNGQIGVDKSGIIIAADVGNNPDDRERFVPIFEQSRENVSGEIGRVLVDGGYYSGGNLRYAVEEGIDLYMPIAKRPLSSNGKFSREDFDYDQSTDSYRCPAGEVLTYKCGRRRNGVESKIYRCSSSRCGKCKLKSKCTTGKHRELRISEVYRNELEMKEKLSTSEGGGVYNHRKGMVEPVFGNMKYNMGFGRFLLRGLQKVRIEFLLMCIAHNLKKITQHIRKFSQRWTLSQSAMDLNTSLLKRIFLYLTLFYASINKLLTISINPKLKPAFR